MFWNLFKKEEKNIHKESVKIKVFDENLNEEILVEKDKWIKTFLYPKMKENINNTENLYNLLLIALNYNIYEEVLEFALILKDKEHSSLRSIEILSEIYFCSNDYREVLSIIDKYISDGNNLSGILYYYYALSHLYLELDVEYEEIIIEGLTKFPNNKKLVKEFIEMLNSKEVHNANELMKKMSEIDGAYRLCMIFAKKEYKSSRYPSANIYILKSILYAKNRVDILCEISEILFKYNQFREFEDHILTKFDINERKLDFCNIVLKYYYLVMKYIEGLDLLKQMYDIKLYDEKILNKLVFYENEFLKMKLKNNNIVLYDRIENENTDGKQQYFNILHPLYYYILNRNEKLEVSKDSLTNIMFLPIAFDTVKPVNKEIKDYLNIIPVLILEKIYKYTNIKFQVTYNKNETSFIAKKGNYDLNFFKGISHVNPKLKYIISGVLKEEKDGTFLEIYRYECEKDQIVSMVSPILVTNVDSYLAIKVIKTITDYFNIMLNLNDFDIKLEDINSIKYSLNLFFDFDKSNKYRYWTMFSQLEYYIKNISKEEDILRALTIIKFMNIYNMEYDGRYRNILYELNLKLNDNKEITSIIRSVFDKEVN